MIRKVLFSFLIVLFFQRVALLVQPFGPLLADYSFSTEIHDRNGKLLRMSLSEDDKYRVFTPLEKISPYTVEGTLLFEDRYFYLHPGVNPFSLGRAFISTYVLKKRVLGASTITMQLVRKMYQLNTRSLKGKLHQISLSLWIEFFYSKKEILQAYFNIAPYGFNIEGVGAASRIYFDRSPKELSLVEATTLSVIPQSPYERTRHIKNKGEANQELKKARNILYKLWVQKFPLDKEEKDLFFVKQVMRAPQSLPFLAPHLTENFLQNKNEPIVKATIDIDLQKKLLELTQAYLSSRKSVGFENASVLLIDRTNMETQAYIGSANFGNNDIEGQVNGLEAPRSPGSALKPFVYGLAIEQGLIHPETMLKDAPTPFGTYTPDNFDKMFAGPLSASDALILSRNIPAIDLASQLENPSLHEFLLRAGIPLNPDSLHYGLSLVLGSAEVTMVELVQLYAMLANEGQWRGLKKKLSDRPERRELFSKEVAFLVLDMLRKNSAPDSEQLRKFQVNPKSIAWKTGTSVGYRDAWSLAVFGDYVMGVWIGNFSGKGNTEFVGRTAAGPLLFNLIEAVSKIKNLDLKEPLPPIKYNLSSVHVCSRSGKIPGPHCPHHKKAWFIPGVSPIETCKVHREIEVDRVTGMQVCPGFEGLKTKQVHEFWPTDLLKVFEEAGLGRRKPPQVHPKCRIYAYGDVAPKILSPKRNIQYNLRSKGSDSKEIPLMAVADGDIRNLTWFINNKKIGVSGYKEPLIWKAVAGSHLLRVVDDQGRFSEIEFNVKMID